MVKATSILNYFDKKTVKTQTLICAGQLLHIMPTSYVSLKLSLFLSIKGIKFIISLILDVKFYFTEV